MRRILLALGLAVALTACDNPSATRAPTDDGTATVPGWIKERESIMPDWLMIARTADGGYVHYNARTIHREADKGTTDVWVQIQHGKPQLIEDENEVTRREIRYNRERFQYRFICADHVFPILQRQVMDGDKVVDTFLVDGADQWRAVSAGGPAQLVEGPACKAA